jgi:ABC-type multidrug transport system ATPase subunit
VLSVEGVGKRFGDLWVFRSISFELSAGDALIVLGRNGSGKSTLLKVIAGLASPSEGKVNLPDGDSRRTLGLSALDIHLYHNLTVKEHFALAAELRGVEPDWPILEQVGLQSRFNQLVGELSSGTKARLKIAIATAAKPQVLLLDEPGVSLDEAGREAVRQICEIQRTRGCLIVATNDPLERSLGTLELDLAS